MQRRVTDGQPLVRLICQGRVLLDEVAEGNPTLKARWEHVKRQRMGSARHHLRGGTLSLRLCLHAEGLSKPGHSIPILEEVLGQVDSTYCLA